MRVRHLTTALLLATAGCLSPVDPASSAAIAVVHATIGDGGFAADTIQVRATTRVRATALAAAGYDLGVSDFTYVSSDPAVAVVDGNGTVRGVAPGSTTITATAPGGKSATVGVVVVPSTIAYTITVGDSPGPITFSTDYTRAYVATAGDSLVVVDALGFFRISAARVGAPAYALAATGTDIYLTHPALDSVTLVGTASSQSLGRAFYGAGPSGIAASGGRAYVAARYDRRLVFVEGSGTSGAVLLGGEPHDLALDGTGTKLFATVENAGAWRVAIVRPADADTAGSFPVAARPSAIASSASGDRLYLLYPAERLVRVYARGSDGGYALQGTVSTGAAPGGIAARHAGDVPYVVVSGEPATVFDGVTLQVYDRVAGVGIGSVAIRPDGLFAFISAPGTPAVNVLGL